MAEFPVTKPKFITPSCVNLSTYIQGMSDYEIICYFSQLIQQWAIEWGQTQQDWKTQQEAFESFKEYVNNEIDDFTNDITGKYTELKNYVDNYFANLDVQQEINNKLEDMEKSGELAAIISQYFSWASVPEDYGAVGDGVTDDTAAVQAALNAGSLVLFRGRYAIYDPVSINSNTTLIGTQKSAIIRKTNTATLCNAHYNDEENGDSNISLYGITVDTDPGDTVYYYTSIFNDVSGLVLENCNFINRSVIPRSDTSIGRWATYISGENIRISNIYINTYNTGIYGDGLHFGSCKNVVATNIISFSSDDSIVFAPINRFKPNKMNFTSENITVSNVVCSSYAANCVRFGDIVEAAPEPAMPQCAYHNCVVENVIYTPGPYALLFAFVDARTGDAISAKGDNLTIRNVEVTAPFGSTQTSSAIIIQGCPFGGPYTTYNYGHIILDNIRYSHNATDHAALYVYGVDFVEFKNCHYKDVGHKTVAAFLGLYNNKILFENNSFELDTESIPFNWTAPSEYIFTKNTITGTYYQATRTINVPENGVVIIKGNEFDSTQEIPPSESTSVALIYGSASNGLSKFIVTDNTFYNERLYFMQSAFYNSSATIKWMQPNAKPYNGYLSNPSS